MSLPRTIPDAARQDLAQALAAAGVQLGGLKPGSRITLLADHDGATWQLTYIGSGGVWKVVGPGQEWGPGALAEDVAGIITASAEPEPDAFPDAPATYLRTPVPDVIRQAWDSPLADGWRLGVRSATAAGTSTARHTGLPDAPQDPAPSPDRLWAGLAAALNALAAAGWVVDFHNLRGPLNGRRHQPYATDDARTDAPWVLFDLTTRRFTVTTRERALNGEHAPAPADPLDHPGRAGAPVPRPAGPVA